MSHIVEKLLEYVEDIGSPEGSELEDFSCEYEGCTIDDEDDTHVHPFGCVRLCTEHGVNHCHEALHGRNTDDQCVVCWPEDVGY